jgi:PKD repeat protein
VASNLQLTPASPTVQDSLFAAYQYTDADQDLESGSQIRWYKNGSLQSSYNNLKSIPSSELAINDSWYFTIEPCDGTIKGKIVVSKKLVIQGVPMQVNFSAVPTSGKEPLRVQFQDLSQGTIKTWLWDFGDGQTSSEQNPVHIYYARQSPYTIKLIVNDASGQDSLTMKNLITVLPSLQAHFSASPISGKPGLEVQFRNETEGTAQYFKWFWGDGTHSTSFADNSNLTHIYKNPGCYSVALKVNGKSITDSVYYKDLIYIHNGVIPLKCIGSGNGVAGTSWKNIIDQDVFTDSGIVIANLSDAWAIFQFSDGIIRKLSDLRIKRANYFSNSISGRLTKKFEIFVTPEEELGDNLRQVLESDLISNEWQMFTFPNDIRARYLVIKILAAEDVSQDTCELAEFQLFGIPDESAIGSESGSHSKYPCTTNLTPNYPNPFNPETRIQYQLAEEGMVSIFIYNLNGELIRILIQESQKVGSYEIRWDGKNNSGTPVSSGIYLCRFQFINKFQKAVIQTQKLTLLK